jgi:RHS repeat-associated protein
MNILSLFSAYSLSLFMSFLLASQASAGTITYYHVDSIGSPVLETNAAGVVTRNIDYRPYGTTELSPAVKGPNFTGHIYDPDLDLVYMKARYYDPSVGRFISADPLRPKDGDHFSFNRYAYGNNNPYTFIDPTGKSALSNFWASVMTSLGLSLAAHGVSGGAMNISTPEDSDPLASPGSNIGSPSTWISTPASPPPPDDDDRWTPPEIRGTQVGLRDPSKVDAIKNDMLNGRYDYSISEGQIGGFKDVNGVYHIGEGHTRVAAAREILRETGNSQPLRNLINNGRWTSGVDAPANSRPLPGRGLIESIRNRIGL